MNPVDRFNPTQAAQQPIETQTFALPLQNQAPASQVQPEPVTPLQASQEYTQAQSSTTYPAQPTPTRKQTDYGDWMAPAAAGVGAGVLGSEAYHQHNAREPTLEEDVPAVTEDQINPENGESVPIMTTTNTMPHSAMHLPVTEPIPTPEEMPSRNMSAQEPLLPTSNTGASDASVFNDNRGVSGGLTSNSSTVPYGINGLGGLERKGAHETGAIFPRVIRHDTDMSVSQLHVPGEFPATSGRAQPTTTVTGDFVPPSAWSLARE